MTTTRTADDVARDLAENARLLDGVKAALRSMPDGKRNTRWHLDRKAARQRLQQQRDQLLAEQREHAKGAAAPTTNKPRKVEPVHGVARLTLSISGTDYRLRRIPTDPSAALRAWRLRKADGTHYTVAVTEHGPCCDCADFTFRRDGLDPNGCKHIASLRAVGLLS
jgi:hypothetical protein